MSLPILLMESMTSSGSMALFMPAIAICEDTTAFTAPDTFLFAAKQLGIPVDECIVIEDSTNGGKAAKAAKMPCIWMHNPDSGDQEIPDAVLEITAWTKENIEKIMKFLHFDQEKV